MVPGNIVLLNTMRWGEDEDEDDDLLVPMLLLLLLLLSECVRSNNTDMIWDKSC
jgi:hypothetical protein